MNPVQMIRLAQVVRPVFRNRTPVLHPLLKRAVRALCPPAEPGKGLAFDAPFEGGRIRIDTGSSIEYHILFRGCHEPAVTDLILRLVRPGDACLDIGANVGALTLVMAKAAGPAGRVAAVEPHPVICARLRENVALNALPNVAVLEAAISDRDGETVFYGFDERAFHRGISSLLPDTEACRAMRVKTVSGPSLQRELGIDRCDFIKIDVEGAESVVLEQLAPLVARCRPVIVCEYRRAHWAKFGHALEPVLEQLRGLGYDLRRIGRKGVATLPAAPPDGFELLAVPPGRTL